MDTVSIMGFMQAEALQPLEPAESVADRTYAALRRALLRREIKAGERLYETAVAARLGVSRTPVREALTRLVAEGLAEDVRGSRGVLVRDVQQELAEIYTLRQVLEGYAARAAAERVSTEQLANIERISAEIAACVHQEEEDDAALHLHAELTNALHLEIAKASGNSRLIRLIEQYRDYFLNVDFLKMYDRATMSRMQDQHDKIVAALRARNGERAEKLVREHFADALAVIDRPVED
ncbi:MAG: GntR family transcriptional regulator [Vulcanimicrobiaceae bacterium]